MVVETREEKDHIEKQNLNSIRKEWQKTLHSHIAFASEGKAELRWIVK